MVLLLLLRQETCHFSVFAKVLHVLVYTVYHKMLVGVVYSFTSVSLLSVLVLLFMGLLHLCTQESCSTPAAYFWFKPVRSHPLVFFIEDRCNRLFICTVHFSYDVTDIKKKVCNCILWNSAHANMVKYLQNLCFMKSYLWEHFDELTSGCQSKSSSFGTVCLVLM